MKANGVSTMAAMTSQNFALIPAPYHIPRPL
jgi:hypothetical protein